ncbi:hypothetical protein BJY52DRAFT_1214634 [Lactarius psammicola]|nr:hypothetical protein BJY52DRAFT_1214634 [Lactarius psammicola]
MSRRPSPSPCRLTAVLVYCSDMASWHFSFYVLDLIPIVSAYNMRSEAPTTEVIRTEPVAVHHTLEPGFDAFLCTSTVDTKHTRL